MSKDRDWMNEGACIGSDPEDWHPGYGSHGKIATRICKSCPVQQQCLEYAVARPELQGIWGGVGNTRRRAMRSKAQADAQH